MPLGLDEVLNSGPCSGTGTDTPPILLAGPLGQQPLPARAAASVLDRGSRQAVTYERGDADAQVPRQASLVALAAAQQRQKERMAAATASAPPALIDFVSAANRPPASGIVGAAAAGVGPAAGPAGRPAGAPPGAAGVPGSGSSGGAGGGDPPPGPAAAASDSDGDDAAECADDPFLTTYREDRCRSLAAGAGAAAAAPGSFAAAAASAAAVPWGPAGGDVGGAVVGGVLTAFVPSGDDEGLLMFVRDHTGAMAWVKASAAIDQAIERGSVLQRGVFKLAIRRLGRADVASGCFLPLDDRGGRIDALAGGDGGAVLPFVYFESVGWAAFDASETAGDPPPPRLPPGAPPTAAPPPLPPPPSASSSTSPANQPADNQEASRAAPPGPPCSPTEPSPPSPPSPSSPSSRPPSQRPVAKTPLPAASGGASGPGVVVIDDGDGGGDGDGGADGGDGDCVAGGDGGADGDPFAPSAGQPPSGAVGRGDGRGDGPPGGEWRWGKS